jgi:hypothetical protein
MALWEILSVLPLLSFFKCDRATTTPHSGALPGHENGLKFRG